MRYAHTNIAAQDWKKVAEFYVNVFNCTPKPPVRNLKGEWLDKATGLKNARQFGIHLNLPGYNDTTAPTLEIFSYDELVETNPLMANYKGFTHIAFEVDNVNEVLEKVIENGGSKLGEVIKNRIEGVGTISFTYCRDCEENIVEIQSWNYEF
jgi:predicted enzyme related to lactoylglutathione lyase